MTTGTFDLDAATGFPNPSELDAAVIAAAAAPEPAAAAGGSDRLARLRSRLDRAVALTRRSEHYDYPVPDSEGLLVVRYRPVDTKLATQIIEEMRGVEGVQRHDVHARLLAAHCSGVFLRDDDGDLVSADVADPDRPAPVFDVRLAEALDLPYVSQQHLVLAFYRLPGYVVSTYEALEADSGYGQADAVRASRGNA